jgi:hypothetical protein
MDAVNDPNDYSPSIPEIWRRYQKRPRPKRLLITSIRDSLVTGSFACTEGMGGASAGGTDRSSALSEQLHPSSQLSAIERELSPAMDRG